MQQCNMFGSRLEQARPDLGTNIFAKVISRQQKMQQCNKNLEKSLSLILCYPG